jgi:hypothetical protein
MSQGCVFPGDGHQRDATKTNTKGGSDAGKFRITRHFGATTFGNTDHHFNLIVKTVKPTVLVQLQIN